MLRVMSAAVAAALFAYGGIAAAQTASYPYSSDGPYSSDRMVSPNYDRSYQQNHHWGNRGISGSTTAPTNAPDRQNSTQRSNNQFASEAEARSNCRGDTVVWVNTKSRVYHFPGSKDFGNTKHGAFMCRADADRTGTFRAAKNEAKPQGSTDQRAPARSGSSLNR
jgi:hypothetical protein